MTPGSFLAPRFTDWYHNSVNLISLAAARKVDVRLPGKGNSNSHDARPVYLIIKMIKWIQTSRLSIKKSLSGSNGIKTTASEGASTVEKVVEASGEPIYILPDLRNHLYFPGPPTNSQPETLNTTP